MLFEYTILTVALFGVAIATPAKRQSCPAGVHMIVARGSTEEKGEGVMGYVDTMIRKRISNCDSSAVDYPATLDNYADSVAQGVDNLKQQLSDYADICQETQIVLLGYSQGGQVITETLAGDARISGDLVQNVKAVVTYGDPTFTSGQSFDVGTATLSGNQSRTGESLDTLKTYASIIQEYCDEGDSHCASGNDNSVHGSYFQKYTPQAVDFVVSKIQ